MSLLEKVRQSYSFSIGSKAKSYLNEFYNKKQSDTTVTAKVMGNHGEYRVSLKLKGDSLNSTCSCYIGKRGGCHHTNALAFSYLDQPDSFVMKKVVKKPNVKTLEQLNAYLESVSLQDLIVQLKKKGISQKAFSENINMSSTHLSAVKKAELGNGHFRELGAIKLACVFVLEKLS